MAGEPLLKAQHQQMLSAAPRLELLLPYLKALDRISSHPSLQEVWSLRFDFLSPFLSYTFKYYIPSSLTFLNKAKCALAHRIFFFRLPAKPPQRAALRSGSFLSGRNSTEPHAELGHVRVLPARRRGRAASRWRCAAGNGPLGHRAAFQRTHGSKGRPQSELPVSSNRFLPGC